MTWTYYYGFHENHEGNLLTPVYLRVSGAGLWQDIDPDGCWKSSEEAQARTKVAAGVAEQVDEQEMSKALWAATVDGDFAEIPLEPRLATYEPDWQYCVLRPVDMGTKTTREMVLSESEDIDFSEIRFGRHNRNHYDSVNFQELRLDGSEWVETELLFVLFAKGDGREEPLDMPAEAVARLIGRAVVHGRLGRRPHEPVTG